MTTAVAYKTDATMEFVQTKDGSTLSTQANGSANENRSKTTTRRRGGRVFINLKITANEREQIRLLAEARNITMTEWIEEAAREHIESSKNGVDVKDYLEPPPKDATHTTFRFSEALRQALKEPLSHTTIPLQQILRLPVTKKLSGTDK